MFWPGEGIDDIANFPGTLPKKHRVADRYIPCLLMFIWKGEILLKSSLFK